MTCLHEHAYTVLFAPALARKAMSLLRRIALRDAAQLMSLRTAEGSPLLVFRDPANRYEG